MKIILTTCIAASMMMVSCGGGDSLTAELNDLAKELDKSNEAQSDADQSAVELEKMAAELEAELAELSISSEIYSPEDGGFKINFFGISPIVSSETVPTDVGNIEMTTYMYEKSVTEVYMVAYSDYPSQSFEFSTPEDLLLGGKEGAISSLGVTQLDLEEDMDLDGNSGLHFKGVAGTFYVEYEMYIVKNRLYQIAILRDGSYPSQTSVDSFLGTFELVD